jgi:hypothetical protein
MPANAAEEIRVLVMFVSGSVLNFGRFAQAAAPLGTPPPRMSK